MTSFGCDEIKACTGWNSCFKVQRQIYHSIGSLAPPENSTAKFAQIYFVGDDKFQSSLRQTVIQGLRSDIVDQLQHMLHQSNSYARSLKMAVDILSSHSQEFKVIIDADKRPSGEHERRFNAPLCNEVGVLMLGEEHGKRDIVLRHNDESLQRVDETHHSYDPLQ